MTRSRYWLSFAQSLEHTPQYPERTARRQSWRSAEYDIEYRIFHSRADMIATIRKRRAAADPTDPPYRAIVPLPEDAR